MYKLFVIAQFINGNSLPQPKADQHTFQHILQLAFGVIAAFAFLMMVIAGFRYVISGGDPSKVSEAKRQVAFSVAGVVLALLAAAIVNFAIGRAG